MSPLANHHADGTLCPADHAGGPEVLRGLLRLDVS